MRGGALRCGILALLAPFLPWAPSALADEAKFRITATWIVNYVEPKARTVLTRRSYIVTLKRDGTVAERLERAIGNGWAGTTLIEMAAELGESGGKRKATVWKVVNETTLVRLVARHSHTFAIWLRTQGTDSCTATLEWRLKPGFTLYEAPKKNGKPQVRFTDPSWPNARCDVL